MTDPNRQDDASGQVVDLARQVEKLQKINNALMQRVERSMDQQANAFSLFQTAITQEAQIRARTEQLNIALSKLADANQELSAARDAAETANRFKTRFFTAVGHDVLQPLHAARLNLSELAEAQIDPANLQLTSDIASALGSVEELLRSILDISKLEAGVFVPNLQRVALDDIFARLFVSLEPVSRRKRLAFRYQSNGLAARTDALMLRRMVQNLAANAIHYTVEGGVLLTARGRGDAVHIEVWDTGPGIEVTEQRSIFQEFQRGKAATVGSGFGLGLAIVKRMGDALGHELRVDSRVGRGSRFTIVAPRDTTQPKASPTELRARAIPSALRDIQILVIDNDLTVLDAMQRLLKRWGSDFRLARNFEDLDELLDDPRFQPAIILADYHLDNELTGLQAIAKVRQVRQRSDLPAILITADHSDATFKAALAADCDVLNKPVQPADLRALIQHLLTRG